MMAQACNPSESEDLRQEDHMLKAILGILARHLSQNRRLKRAGGVAWFLKHP